MRKAQQMIVAGMRHGFALACACFLASLVLTGPVLAQQRATKDIANAKKIDPVQTVDVSGIERIYRCSVTAILREVHRQPLQLKDRFVVFFADRRPESYLQCHFFNDDRQILCEATSGFYSDVRHVDTVEKLNTLEALGFSTGDTKGNFRFERPVPDLDALYDVAGTLLETLARVYDFPVGAKLAFNAPLVASPPSVHIEGTRYCADARNAPKGAVQ